MQAKGFALKNPDSFFNVSKLGPKKLVFSSYTMSVYRLLERHTVTYTVTRRRSKLTDFPPCLLHGFW